MATSQESTSSRLIARLREVSKGTPSPLGFVGRTQSKSLPAMLLIASLARNDSALAEAAVAGGTDALLCHVHAERKSQVEGQDPTRFGSVADEASRLEEVVSAASRRPVGVAVGTEGTIRVEELSQLDRLGVDFVVIHPHRAPLALLEIETLGHVARLDRDSPSGAVRGLNELGVDAVELTATRPDGSLPQLTIHDLANYRQMLEGIRRPVLLAMPWTLSPADLKRLRELGAEGLVVTPEVLGQEPESVKAMIAGYRQAIDALGPPIGRGRAMEGRRVVLPQVKPAAEEEDEDDDE